jgi:glycosyltransferase involved in cell wall biosynthesis
LSMKRVFISVTSDLVTDQRVHRAAITLHKKGLDVTVIGRKKEDSAEVVREYKTVRFKLFFEKGAFFYATFNLRLFFFLLFKRIDVLVANDLDTLLPKFLISKLKKAELFYDSHEYFTEVPELAGRPLVKNIWKAIERFIFPQLKHVYTVNESIAELYKKEYRQEISVIRNVPFTQTDFRKKTRRELNLPDDKKIILFQGAGINIDRGAEEALTAMNYLPEYLLLFIGSGDIIEKLKTECIKLNLIDRVRFIPKRPMKELKAYTTLADIGLSLDKDTNINYRYSLPNKLFDYIHAGLPVLASNLVEVKKIVEGFNIGMCIDSHEPKVIAEKIKEMFADAIRFNQWKENLKSAAKELCWEKEEEKFLEIYRAVL